MSVLFEMPSQEKAASSAEEVLVMNLTRFEGRTDMADVLAFITKARKLTREVPAGSFSAAFSSLVTAERKRLYAIMRTSPARMHPYFRGQINIINNLAAKLS